MKNVSVNKSTLKSFLAGDITFNEFKASCSAALSRTYLTVDGERVDIAGCKGFVWMSYAKLVSRGLASTYGAVSNGRFLPVTVDGDVIPGYSWKGSATVELVHELLD
jgi:hypothetical protein